MARTPEEEPAGAESDPPGHDTLALVVGGTALVLLLLSPWLVDRSGPEPFYKGPLIFPVMVLATIVAGALPAMVRTARNPPRSPFHFDGAGFPARGAALFVLMCFYPVAISAAGLEIATFAAIFLGLLVTGRKPVHSAIIAAGMTILTYLAFKQSLDIWFPQPWLFDTGGN